MKEINYHMVTFLCSAADCRMPEYTPANITVTLVNGNTRYGSMVLFVCDTGYILRDVYNSSVTQTCGSNGSWTGTVETPTCGFIGMYRC